MSALLPVGGGAPFRSYVYDGEDQLRRATTHTTTPGTTTEEYFYDHAGQRTAVVSRNNSGSVTSVRVFLGDSEVVLTPSGAVDRTYAHLSLVTPVARISDRTDLQLQYQGLADNSLLSVQPDGAIQSGFVYAPYGELLESTGTSVADQHRRFNDKFRDDATKLSCYGVRYYDGVLLAWTQADPRYRFLPDTAWTEPRRGALWLFSQRRPEQGGSCRVSAHEDRLCSHQSGSRRSGCWGRTSSHRDAG